MNRVLTLGLALIGLAILTTSSQATVLSVPSVYPTIQAAIDAGFSGDTILVDDGLYIENLNFLQKALVLTSVNGASATTLTPADAGSSTIIMNANNDGSELSGFTVTGGGAVSTVLISNGSAVVQRNIFHDNIPPEATNVEVISLQYTSSLVTRNLFYNNQGIGCVGLRTDAEGSQIINNTFDANKRGFYSIAAGGTARNNIVTNSTERGIGALSSSNWSQLDYNDVWNNNPDYQTLTPGSHDISADPLYVGGGDYALSLGSPCIDAGDPDPIYNDLDGTRNDMGAVFSSDHNYPLAIEVTVSPLSVEGCVNVGDPVIAWVYLDTAGSTQSAYQIQVSSDGMWDSPDLWDSGPVASAATSAVYGGFPFPGRNDYYLRIRLESASGWGDWTDEVFCYVGPSSTIKVPQDQPTIQAAVDIAIPGDTVLLAPGVYTENVVISGEPVVLLSEAGCSQTTLTPAQPSANALIVQNVLYPGMEISGITVTGGGGNAHTIRISTADVHIHDCLFKANIPFGSPNVEVISLSSSSSRIEHNLFYGNGGIGCVGLRGGAEGSRIINNTFDSNERGFFSVASGGTAQNNIVTNSLERGIGAYSSSNWSNLDYNDVWNNHPNYDALTPGANDISVDPQYASPSHHLYLLVDGSPCIDAGNPDPQYDDPDLTRADMGAFYQRPAPPSAPVLTSPADVSSGPLYDLTPLFAWTESIAGEGVAAITYDLVLAVDSNLTFVQTFQDIPTNGFQLPGSLSLDQAYWWRVTATDGALSTNSNIGTFRTWKPGDVDGSFLVNVSDLTFLVAYLFTGGPAPDPVFIGDMDGSCEINVSDIVTLVGFLFQGGNAPIPCLGE